MRVLLINPPYVTLTSRFGVGHQVPLGLLMVGGALRDDGHEVRLLDAECRRLSHAEIVCEVRSFAPDVVMTGHAGSTPAHPVCVAMLREIKSALPNVTTVYGGPFPTYHAPQILAEPGAVDIIVRGEGEATACDLLAALRGEHDLTSVMGISFLRDGQVFHNPDRAPIANLDEFRTGWELIEDWDAYTCFGLGRAAIVQFSRGCPHRCTYCGQHGFWVSWRHCDPVKLADEIEWLHKTHNIKFITLADENPTTLQPIWKAFLEEIASRELDVHFFATIRATDIVRDAELLPLYKRAGLLYVLMGIESTDARVLKAVHKGSTPRHDLKACHLLREHEIFSVMGHIVGLGDETWAGFRATRRHLQEYDGDYLNAMYVTPHSWTQFAHDVKERRVAQTDQRRWDYRHQVLEERFLKPWQLFFAVKWLELCFHLHPRKLWKLLRERDAFRRRQQWWTLWHTSHVWLGEIADFVFATKFVAEPDTLKESRIPLLALTKRNRFL